MVSSSTRHKWDEAVQFWTKDEVPVHYKTERTCPRCDMTRVTCHELKGVFEEHRTEFWRDGDQVLMQGDRRPLCDARLEWAQEAASAAVPA